MRDIDKEIHDQLKNYNYIKAFNKLGLSANILYLLSKSNYSETTKKKIAIFFVRRGINNYVTYYKNPRNKRYKLNTTNISAYFMLIEYLGFAYIFKDFPELFAHLFSVYSLEELGDIQKFFKPFISNEYLKELLQEIYEIRKYLQENSPKLNNKKVY